MTKSFKSNLTGAVVNPAMQFISTPEEPERQPPQQSDPRAETKSRRLQLLIRPGLYGRVKRGAARRGISVNEYIHVLLERALDE